MAASVTSKDGTVSKKHKAAVYVTVGQVAKGLSVFSGMRLDQTVCYFPVLATELKTKYDQKPACPMCRWAIGKQYRAQASYCKPFSPILCVWRYKSFHTMEDLEEKKEHCEDILTRKANKGGARNSAGT